MTSYLIRSFVDNADPERSAKRSFKNFHAEGVTYVNLAFSEDVVAKLYFLDNKKLKTIPFRYVHEGMVVNPHSHLYDFHTYVIRGQLLNIPFRNLGDVPARGKSHFVYHEHRYHSPLRGEKRTQYAGKTTLELDIRDLHNSWLSAGNTYSLRHDEIHSIAVSDRWETILFLLQHRDKDKEFTSLFTKTEELPDLTGLYLPMTPKEVEEHLDRIVGDF